MPARDELSHNLPLSQQLGTVFGIAWYRPDQWQKLQKISVDRADLEETHAEWLEIATEKLLELKQMGVTVRPFEVDVDELARWCKQHKRPVDAAARSEFVAHKLAEEDANTTPA